MVSYFGMTIVVRWFSRSFGPRLNVDLLAAMLCSVLYLLIGIWYWNGNGFQSASFWTPSTSSLSARTVDVLPSDHTTSTLGCCCCCCCWVGVGKPNVPNDVPFIHAQVTIAANVKIQTFTSYLKHYLKLLWATSPVNRSKQHARKC